jgi:hypothetical protein
MDEPAYEEPCRERRDYLGEIVEKYVDEMAHAVSLGYNDKR